MNTSRTNILVSQLNKTFTSFKPNNYDNPQKKMSITLRRRSQWFPNQRSRSKLSEQRDDAQYLYEYLTNLTKLQQKQTIWNKMRENHKKKRQWSYNYYTGNNKNTGIQKTFSINQNSKLQPFPSNNVKYNVQFLQRSLHGINLKFPRNESGYFRKPSNSLYSKHYKPIVKQKVKYNEDYQLRESLFGKTWVDRKRDKVMNQYETQVKPFRTPRSNDLIARMSNLNWKEY